MDNLTLPIITNDCNWRILCYTKILQPCSESIDLMCKFLFLWCCKIWIQFLFVVWIWNGVTSVIFFFLDWIQFFVRFLTEKVIQWKVPSAFRLPKTGFLAYFLQAVSWSSIRCFHAPSGLMSTVKCLLPVYLFGVCKSFFEWETIIDFFAKNAH